MAYQGYHNQFEKPPTTPDSQAQAGVILESCGLADWKGGVSFDCLSQGGTPNEKEYRSGTQEARGNL